MTYPQPVLLPIKNPFCGWFEFCIRHFAKPFSVSALYQVIFFQSHSRKCIISLDIPGFQIILLIESLFDLSGGKWYEYSAKNIQFGLINLLHSFGLPSLMKWMHQISVKMAMAAAVESTAKGVPE